MKQNQKGAFEMKKWDDLVDYLQDKNLVSSDILSKYCAKNELKTENEQIPCCGYLRLLVPLQR